MLDAGLESPLGCRVGEKYTTILPRGITKPSQDSSWYDPKNSFDRLWHIPVVFFFVSLHPKCEVFFGETLRIPLNDY